MRFQELDYSCGAAAFLNCLRVFSMKIDEKTARELCHTQSDGTNEKNIIRALNRLGFEAKELYHEKFKNAYAELQNALSNGSPVILCVDNYAHWVLATGKIGEKIILFDSANSPKNKSENGIQILSKDQLRRRWQHRKPIRLQPSRSAHSRTHKTEYYGIQVIHKHHSLSARTRYVPTSFEED